MRLSDTLALFKMLRKYLRFARVRPRLVLAGSARRGESANVDVDILVVVPACAPASTLASAHAGANAPFEIVGDRVSGPRHRIMLVSSAAARLRRFPVDLFLVHAHELPYALFHYTGSRIYNVRTRAHAKRRGWRLNQYGLFDAATGRRVRGSANVRTEREVAALIGVSYRSPDDRVK
jgi:DNA polymerase (family 10)